MRSLPLSRINDVLDFDNYYPAGMSSSDVFNLYLDNDVNAAGHDIGSPRSYTARDIRSDNIFNQPNPDIDAYFDSLASEAADATSNASSSNANETSSAKSHDDTDAQNNQPCGKILKNQLGQSAYAEPVINANKWYKTWLTLNFSQSHTQLDTSKPNTSQPNTSQIVALYYRLVADISHSLSVNNLNLVVKLHSYVANSNNSHSNSSKATGNAAIQNLNFNVMSLNDYYVPSYDELYTTCINNDVLTHVRTSYAALHQAYNAYNNAPTLQGSQSTIKPVKSFMQGLVWLMVSTAINNIYASTRSLLMTSWSANIIDTLTPHALTVFDAPDLDAQQSIDSFNKIQTSINNWLEELLIERRKKLAKQTISNYKPQIKSPKGCITFFEANNWINMQAGAVHFEARHLITTANYVLFSGFLEQFTWTLISPKKAMRHSVAKTWMNHAYLLAMLNVCKQLGETIQEHDAVKQAYKQAVLHHHRHYYSPNLLLTMLDDS